MNSPDPTSKPTAESHRIPTLDGWRGIAILMVLADHVFDRRFHYFYLFGQHGVAIFFVLSGFLITSRLLAELDATGDLRLRRFYIRRFFRLMPCAWLYLLVVALVFHQHHGRNLGIIPSLLFFRNYHGGNDFTGQFWTLSIEEQFYLVWPATLLLFRRRAWIVAVLGCLIVCVWRLADWNYIHSIHPMQSQRTQYQADTLLLGCLLALFIEHLRPFLRAWLALPLLAALVACIAYFDKIIPLHESLVIALLLGVTSSNPGSLLSRFLQLRWLVQIGLISYSIYVWQQFTKFPWGGPIYITAPALIAAALTIGYLSYTFVENPMNRLGRTLSERVIRQPQRKLQPPENL